MSLSPQALVNIAVQAAKDKKAEDITVLDIRKISIIADYFLICSGRSSTHVQAIVENIQEKLEEKNINALRREGFREGEWVLLDYGDVVIHVFQELNGNFITWSACGGRPVVGCLKTFR